MNGFSLLNCDNDNEEKPFIILPIDNCCCRGICPPKPIKTYHFDNVNLTEFKENIKQAMNEIKVLKITNTEGREFNVDKITYEYEDNKEIKLPQLLKLEDFLKTFNNDFKKQLANIMETETNKYIIDYCEFVLRQNNITPKFMVDKKRMFMLDMFNDNNESYNIKNAKIITDDGKFYRYNQNTDQFEISVQTEEEKNNKHDIKQIKTNKLNDLNKYIGQSVNDPFNNDGMHGVVNYWLKDIEYSYENWMQYFTLIDLPEYGKLDVKISNARSCAKSCLWIISVFLFIAAIFGGLAAIIVSFKD